MWVYTSIKRHTYFWISFSVGKWTQQTCREMMEQMFSRLELPFPDDKIEIYTDGNDDYTYVLPNYYADTCIDYGQMVKIRKGGRVVDKIKRIIFGNPCPGDIETTNVENFNGILRERNGRLVRKTKCFSKLKWRAKCSLLVFQFHWNFINKFRRGSTPGMLEGIVEKPWTWDDFLMFHKAV
jgi:hypothetical protein